MRSPKVQKEIDRRAALESVQRMLEGFYEEGAKLYDVPIEKLSKKALMGFLIGSQKREDRRMKAESEESVAYMRVLARRGPVAEIPLGIDLGKMRFEESGD
jgi:hypothetical protein